MEVSRELLSPSLHLHRLDNTSSKLPTFRPVDITGPADNARVTLSLNATATATASASAAAASAASASASAATANKNQHNRNQSASTIATSPPKPLHQRNSTYPGDLSPRQPLNNPPPTTTSITPKQQRARRDVPASQSRNKNGPPLSMITQGYFEPLEPDASTTDWVAQQSLISPVDDSKSPLSPAQLQPKRSVADTTSSRPLIKPIRGFKPSARKSVEMNANSSHRPSIDPDSTIRGVEVFGISQKASNQPEQDGQNSDDSDLFLRAAREEELTRQANNLLGNAPVQSDNRRVRERVVTILRPEDISFPIHTFLIPSHTSAETPCASSWL